MTNVVTNSPCSIILVQRQTVDWANLSDEDFHQQSRDFCALWGKPLDYIWELFQLWNQTFTVDYRDVRQQLKNLAYRNISCAKDTHFVSYEHYQNIPQQEGYYIFLDDDDWVDPDIVIHLSNHLTMFDKKPALLLWRSANIGSPHQEHVVFLWGMNGRCMTNNYAVHRNWVEPFSKIYQILQHKDAEKIFNENKQVPHLDCALTVSNKSPISSVSLDRGLNGEWSSTRLVELVENYVNRVRSVQDQDLIYIPWSREYLQQTLSIFEHVLHNLR